MRIKQAAGLAVLLTTSWTAMATGVTITDYSFENLSANVSAPKTLGLTIIGTNSYNFGLWTGLVGSSVIGLTPGIISVGTAASLGGPTPIDGSYDARLTLAAGVGSFLSMRQTLSTAFQSYSTYRLSLDIDVGANISLFTHSSLNLTAGNNAVASISDASLISLMNTTTGFQTIDLDYTTGAIAPTGNIGIEFDVNSLLGLGGNVYLDNARITVATVPEPRPGYLVGAGFGSLFLIGRFKKKTV